jgi:cytochrome c peroxidase
MGIRDEKMPDLFFRAACWRAIVRAMRRGSYSEMSTFSGVLSLLLFGAMACGARAGMSPGGDSSLGPNAVPQLTVATKQALLELSPPTLPAPPPDVSNRFADNPTAAAFGHKLFFDPEFSGALLDSDNIGDSHSLGRMGDTGKVACAGCHIPAATFLDNRSTRAQVSLAAAWGRRRTRHLLDVGQAKIIMWDGRHDALYNQPFQPIESVIEMNSSRLFAAQQIYAHHRPEYEAIFGPIPVPLDDSKRFPQLDPSTTGCRKLSGTNEGIDCHGMPGDNAEFDHLSPADQDEVTRIVVNMGKALGAYERRLTCGQSRFDLWMHGQQDALNPAEQRGAALFVGQREDGTVIVGCNACHTGPFFTDQTFHNVGLAPVGVGPAGSFLDLDDHGAKEGLNLVLSDPLNVRGKFSDGDDGRLPRSGPGGNADGAFRTPSLRCASRRPTFMHTGQLFTLEDVVAFFDRGGSRSGYPGTSENFPRNFTAQERADLAAFIRALDGPGPDAQLVASP